MGKENPDGVVGVPEQGAGAAVPLTSVTGRSTPPKPPTRDPSPTEFGGPGALGLDFCMDVHGRPPTRRSGPRLRSYFHGLSWRRRYQPGDPSEGRERLKLVEAINGSMDG